MRRTRSETADFVIQQLKILGINPHPQSRFMKMQRVFKKAYTKPNDPDFEIGLEAVRDIELLNYVLQHADSLKSKSQFLSILKKATDDSVLSQNDKKNSPGRDFQFELHIATICQNAGLLPVDIEEPDITCELQGIKIGIAAKRAKTVAKIFKRIKEATKQIEKTELPGIIAVDTCLAFNQNNDRIYKPIQNEEFTNLHHEYFQKFLRLNEQQLRSITKGDIVQGIIFHDHQVRQTVYQDWELASLTMWFSTSATNSSLHTLSEEFYAKYKCGLPDSIEL